MFKIIDIEGLLATFGMIAYLSYLFSLSFPSEALQLRAAFTSSKPLKFPPRRDKALIGTVDYEGASALVIKFKYRRNIRGRCVLIRQRICHEVSQLARRFCPVRGFRASIAGNTPRGALCSQKLPQIRLTNSLRESGARPGL